nr:putative mitochondrial protein [Ipomoea batatas]
MKPGEKEVNTLLRNEASCLFFFKPPIRSRSPLLTGSRLISLPLATKMFQFAKFEKSKERRLATELGYGFPIGDPWITDEVAHSWSPSEVRESMKGHLRLRKNSRKSITERSGDLVLLAGREKASGPSFPAR